MDKMIQILLVFKNIVDISDDEWRDVSHGDRVVPASWCPGFRQKATKQRNSESANNCKETVKHMKEEEERRIDERVNRTESM